MEPLDVDVLIVGAGISGIDMACRMTDLAPGHTFALLEARDAIGGTWDLFRYPGIRSDSDMYTLAFPFRPWTSPEAIAGADSILTYLRDTAREFGIDRRIHHGQRVTAASWSSDTQQWTVRADTPEGPVQHTARFLYLGTGYYDYDAGHVVDFPGQESFAGRLVHPQFWPEDLDVTGKRIVVIGSGATAVTLIPALVDQGASHVTMLQRSPSYVLSQPGSDVLAKPAFATLPPLIAHRALRAKNLAMSMAAYQFVRRFPKVGRALLTKGAESALPPSYAAARHFRPAYDPWDQRLCLVPDGDLFEAIGSGRADVVTDTIAGIEPRGIHTTSGELLEADVIVTATGLKLVVAGKIALDIDGERVRPEEEFVYKGLMLSGVPNLAWCVGYVNNSWTLRADLAARWTCRLLNHLRDSGFGSATPRREAVGGEGRPIIDLTSGYIQRSAAILPKQGVRSPWTFKQNYLQDLVSMSRRSFDDPDLEFAERRRTLT